MDEASFRQALLRARTRATVEPQHAHYWRGYREGLCRARAGEAALGAPEHRLLLAAGRSRDPRRAAAGAGYRDGLRAYAHGLPRADARLG